MNTTSRLRTSTKTGSGARHDAPHLVAAVSHDGATVLGQRRIDSKSNEIPAVRKLLKDVDVTGAMVTVDAMHTRRATARCCARHAARTTR